MLVKEIMGKKIVTISKEDNILKSFAIMMKKGIRHLPVVENKEIIGIISDRDIRQSLTPWEGSNVYNDLLIETNKKEVKEIMVNDVFCVKPTTSVEEAAHIMNENKIGCLPVISNSGKLLGIITKSDLIEIFISIMELLQKSSRIDILIKDNPKDLKKVENIVQANGGEIISVGVSPSKKYKDFHIHLFRLKVCDTEHIVSEIKKKGFKVISVI